MTSIPRGFPVTIDGGSRYVARSLGPGGSGCELTSGAAPTDGHKSGAPGARIHRPSVQGLVALGIYLAVWLPTVMRPLVEHIGRSQLAQTSPDPNFYLWSLRWWPYALGHGLNPLYSNQLDAPLGHALAWTATVPALSLLVSPLTLTAGPVVAFNVLAIVAVPACAWAAFVLCRRLTGKFWPALAAGAVFGCSAYETNHFGSGQMNLTYTLLLPILAYLMLLWRDKAMSSRAFVILAGMTMAAEFYISLEIFADLTAFLVICFGLGWLMAGRRYRAELLSLAGLTALGYVFAAVLAAPYIRYALVTTPPKPPALVSLDLASLVIPRAGRTFGIPWLASAAAGPHPVSNGGYVGVPLLVLAVLLAVTAWSSRLVRFLSAMLVLIVTASLGPELYLEGRPVARLPWAALYQLPIVRNAYATRLMLFAYLALAVTVALWLALSARRLAWGRYALALLVIGTLAADTPAIVVTQSSTVPVFISSGQYRRDLSSGEIVVVVSNVRNAGMLWQAQSGFYFRIAGGFLNEGFSHRTDLPVPVQRLVRATPASVASFEQYVKADHVGAILLDARYLPRWAGIFGKIGLVGHRAGSVIVYPTDACQACRALVRRHARRTLA
jgi:hypothetical protein